jgi:hypothetical protein
MKSFTPDPNKNLQSRRPAEFSRRRFLSSCTACAACAALAPMSFIGSSCSSATGNRKMKIRVVYSLHAPLQGQPDWPNIGFDFNPPMDNINATLTRTFPDIEFLPVMAKGEKDASKIASQDIPEKIDGYIVYQMNCWNRVVQTIAKTNKPVLYADFQFGGSGGFLVYTAAFLREKTPNVGYVASSKMEDFLSAVGCFKLMKESSGTDFSSLVTRARLTATRAAGSYTPVENNISFLSPQETIKQLGESKILAVRDQNSEKSSPIMGIPLEYIPFSEVNSAWSSVKKDDSMQIVERWKKTALAIVDVSDETLLTSAAMYLGMKNVLRNHGATAITVNCLGGFYGGHIHAYPCLGFHELNNEGLVGACECDVRSTATMLAFTTMTNGRPGYISDPVIDTSKRQIIYAHCVAPNKAFGPQGSINPFKIMTHSEDRNGASVRSILPVNHMTTTLEIDKDKKEILFHQAIALDNDPDDRACRTKLCAEPIGDIEKLFTMWDKWGWHRVTFYGDLKEPVHAFADAIGWKVTEEA